MNKGYLTSVENANIIENIIEKVSRNKRTGVISFHGRKTIWELRCHSMNGVKADS